MKSYCILCAAVVLQAVLMTPHASAATCGNGNVGDGICPQQCAGGSNMCCSQWGWCGCGSAFCGNTAPPSVPATSPPISGEVAVAGPDSRLIAYMGNWQSCPTVQQLQKYTHVVIAFAVSYTWSPGKNQCSETCTIETPPICNNAANPTLIENLQKAGKKVILSFGGAGMGGSWSGDQNDCWEHCFGRETQVVERLTEIVNEMGLDGVDIDYEYFYDDNQPNAASRGFTSGDEARNFLKQVTLGLRQSLPKDAEITHAPMDTDVKQGTGYYEVLKQVASSLDYLMPQYYNGFVRPARDGLTGGNQAALSHYKNLVEDMFSGDATKIVFGFCISDCPGFNAKGQEAATVMTELNSYYSCNGGAFFWVANHDVGGSWSSIVSSSIEPNFACSVGPTHPPVSQPAITVKPSGQPTHDPTNETPVAVPTPTPSPSRDTGSSKGDMCCPPGYNGLYGSDSCGKYHHCVNGQVTGDAFPCPAGTLFDYSVQFCNWRTQVSTCHSSCEASTSNSSDKAPSPAPTPVISDPPTADSANPESMCCPTGFTGLRAMDSCKKFYHCHSGMVQGSGQACPPGTLFDSSIGNCNWESSVSSCEIISCTRRLRHRSE